MIHGKKKSLNGSLYLKTPHFCPKCKTQMQSITVKKAVDSHSAEAKQYDFSIKRGTHMVGNIEFSWNELKCPYCDYQLSIDEMQKFELESMDADQLKKHERKEKIKVALFKVGFIIFALLLLIAFINK